MANNVYGAIGRFIPTVTASPQNSPTGDFPWLSYVPQGDALDAELYRQFQAAYPDYIQHGALPTQGKNVRDPSQIIYDPTYGYISPHSNYIPEKAGFFGKDFLTPLAVFGGLPLAAAALAPAAAGSAAGGAAAGEAAASSSGILGGIGSGFQQAGLGLANISPGLGQGVANIGNILNTIGAEGLASGLQGVSFLNNVGWGIPDPSDITKWAWMGEGGASALTGAPPGSGGLLQNALLGGVLAGQRPQITSIAGPAPEVAQTQQAQDQARRTIGIPRRAGYDPQWERLTSILGPRIGFLG